MIKLQDNYPVPLKSMPLEEMLAIAKRAKRFQCDRFTAGFYPREIKNPNKPLYDPDNSPFESGDVLISLHLKDRGIFTPDVYEVTAEVINFEAKHKFTTIGRTRTLDRRVSKLFRYAQEQAYEDSIYRTAIARAEKLAEQGASR